MTKTDITKETLIKLWEKACENNTDYSCFREEGSQEEPYGFIIIQDDKAGKSIMLGVNATMEIDNSTTNGALKHVFRIQVYFDGYVEYRSFELEKEEFESLIESFNRAQSLAVATRKKEIIESREKDLEKLIKLL